MAPPELVVVGHVTKDLAGDGYVLGGGATYAALAAQRLGQAAAVLTRADPSVAASLPSLLPGVSVCCLPSAHTTTFRNRYLDGRRQQHLLAVAEPLRAADVPPDWCSAALVLLSPVAGEVQDDILEAFPDATVGLAAQGWLRQVDGNGLVLPAPWRGAPSLLTRAKVVVLSQEDVAGDAHAVRSLAQLARTLVVTHGDQGATVFSEGNSFTVPAFPARNVDPTGAGDVFAMAFLIAYNGSVSLGEAARFASCAASFVVEQTGTSGIPTREQVLARLAGTSARGGQEVEHGRQ